MGWEAGVNKSFREAPQFISIYTMMIAAGALVVLVPKAPLVFLMVLSAVINGLMLPFVLVFVVRLINNPKIMGEFINSRAYNIISWSTVAAVALLTVLFVFATVFPII
jgi:Mn2+/Fe2+ NRAMP family transporter